MTKEVYKQKVYKKKCFFFVLTKILKWKVLTRI